jgi:hypothetical protein
MIKHRVLSEDKTRRASSQECKIAYFHGDFVMRAACPEQSFTMARIVDVVAPPDA